jgi:hypothetical protein
MHVHVASDEAIVSLRPEDNFTVLSRCVCDLVGFNYMEPDFRYVKPSDIADAGKRSTLVAQYAAYNKGAYSAEEANTKMLNQLNSRILMRWDNYSHEFARTIMDNSHDTHTKNALARFTSPDISIAANEFHNTVLALPEFQGDDGAEKLYKNIYKTSPAVFRKEAKSIIYAMFKPKKYDEEAYGLVNIDPEGKLSINKPLLQNIVDQKYSGDVEEFRINVEKCAEHLTEKYNLGVPYSSIQAQRLSPEASRAIFNDIVSSIDNIPLPNNVNHESIELSREFILSALNHERYVIFIDAQDTTAFHAENRFCAGFSAPGSGLPPAIFIATHLQPAYVIASQPAYDPNSHIPPSPPTVQLDYNAARTSIIDAFLEEAAHGFMLDMYKNQHRPYMDDTDPRKLLFEEALAKDCCTQPRIKELQLEGYEKHEWAAEIPVKILKQMAQGTWTNVEAEKYPHLNQFVNDVI